MISAEHPVDTVYGILDECRADYIAGADMPIRYVRGVDDRSRYYIEVAGVRFGWVIQRTAPGSPRLWDSYVVGPSAYGGRVANGEKTRRAASEDVLLAAYSNRYTVAHTVADRLAGDRRYAELMAEINGVDS